MNPVDIISKKRDALQLTRDEIFYFVDGFVGEEITDYQMAAFLMAVRIQGMERGECIALTKAMLESGDRFTWPQDFGPVVDKHSTGGVGDKVSIVLAPLAAATGLKVPMISGRGLAHSGGTLDKLESIPGFQTQLAPENLATQLKDLGTFMMGQTQDIAPADRRMYAIRDVTGAVESVPLITSSILSKKLAAGLDGLVMDVKVGSGSFMKTLEDAKELAESLVEVGSELGLSTSALLTNMDEPLGFTIGNRVEIEESIDLLSPDEDSTQLQDLREVVVELNSMMLIAGSISRSIEDAREISEAALEDGKAWEVFQKMLRSQGGDLEDFREQKTEPLFEYRAPLSGELHKTDALSLGRAALFAGAGRMKAEDSVDSMAGIRLLRKSGARVEKGEVLARIYTSQKDQLEVINEQLDKAFIVRELRSGNVQDHAKNDRSWGKSLILGKIDSNGWNQS